MKITTSVSGEKDARSLEIEYNLGSNAAEAATLFGEDVVHGSFVAAAKVQLQGVVRRLMKAGKKDSEVLEFVSAYKLGIKTSRGKSALEKTQDLFGKLSPEEKKELLESLR